MAEFACLFVVWVRSGCEKSQTFPQMRPVWRAHLTDQPVHPAFLPVHKHTSLAQLITVPKLQPSTSLKYKT